MPLFTRFSSMALFTGGRLARPRWRRRGSGRLGLGVCHEYSTDGPEVVEIGEVIILRKYRYKCFDIPTFVTTLWNGTAVHPSAT